jgi:hypothetical protein
VANLVSIDAVRAGLSNGGRIRAWQWLLTELWAVLCF